jgi:PhnB protein
MAAQPIPKGYNGAIPYLIVNGATKAIEFYQRAFGAVQKERMTMPDGRIGHAELRIGDAVIMLADEFPDMKIVGPQTLGGSPVGILIYVEDVDARFAQAVAAGAAIQRPLKDQFYGDRSGTVVDPFGHVWNLATHKEDVPPELMKQRMAESMKKPA